MRVDLQDGYATVREQRRAGILALAWELGRQPLHREIVALLDVSSSYASSLTQDPDGAKERERKDRYRGTCEKCGGPTDGSNGFNAPKVCIHCLTRNGGPSGARPTRRVWNREKCLDSIVRWIDRHGAIPRTIDFVFADPGERPCWQTICRHCIGYETRTYRRFDPRLGQEVERVYVRQKGSLPDLLVEIAHRIPPEVIVSARNAWVRARMFEVVGIENIVTTAGEQIAIDDFGTLWKIERDEWPEPVVMVQVLNSTPEPDGTFKDYFLRVPPDTLTPRDGVAWTFDVEADEYDVAVAT